MRLKINHFPSITAMQISLRVHKSTPTSIWCLLALIMLTHFTPIYADHEKISADDTIKKSAASTFYVGGDVSFVTELENNSVVYRDQGISRDLFRILSDHGQNLIRLRLWHTPSVGYNDLADTITKAIRARDVGMDILLDFHYSDTWADPGTQTKPAAWQGQTLAELKSSLYQYTRQSIEALVTAGVTPAMVQVGNEITPGFLWNEGRVGGAFNTPQQWTQFTDLLKEAIRGVRDATPAGEYIQVILHSDRGGDAAGANWFFSNIESRNVSYDLIGLSYYPWWHGQISDFRQTLDLLSTNYSKEIILVETAYPWTLQWFDSQNNFVGLPSQLLAEYPATPAGQAAFLRTIRNEILQTPGGIGIVYWAPEWIVVSGKGSSWENLALFDNNGELLIGADAMSARTTNTSPDIWNIYD